MDINTITQLPVGSTIDALYVRVDDIRKQYQGDGNYGPYSYQNCKCQDNTGNLPLLFKSRDDVSMHNGAILKAEAYFNKSNELKGIAVGRDKNGNKEIIISKGATVNIVDDADKVLFNVGHYAQPTSQATTSAPLPNQGSLPNQGVLPASNTTNNTKAPLKPYVKPQADVDKETGMRKSVALKAATSIMSAMSTGLLNDIKAVKIMDSINQMIADATMRMAEQFEKHLGAKPIQETTVAEAEEKDDKKEEVKEEIKEEKKETPLTSVVEEESEEVPLT